MAGRPILQQEVQDWLSAITQSFLENGFAIKNAGDGNQLLR
jgi:hypothetical protein